MPVHPLLDVNNLTVTFRKEAQETVAVDGISFSIMKNEILAIIGESGSGKSVTALSLLGLIPDPPGRTTVHSMQFADEGQGVIHLETLSDKEYQEIRGKSISMIFQEPMTSLNPVFTCGDQVSEPISRHTDLSGKGVRKRVLDLFNEVALPDPVRIYRSYPHELSGGQLQRVMIAMAISCNPRLLIADEPTTALDVPTQKTILDLLGHLQRTRNMSILFITHDLGLLPLFAHRMMVMFRGKIIEHGATDQIFRNPQHPYTVELLASRPGRNARAGVLSQAIPQAMATREPLLKVEHLFKNYSRKGMWMKYGKSIIPAAEDLSFELFPGETLGIVGESGCGKTTLSRMVLRLIPPSEGRIIFKNKDITALTSGRRRALSKDLQIVFQDPYSSLNPRMTVGAALLEPMKVHRLHRHERERKRRVAILLGKVGLDSGFAARYPHELSGGQRQRIVIARALAVEPKLLICDEAVSALDVSIQAQILLLLNSLKKELGLTYIFISHDLNVVHYMSDRILVMRDGKIVEAGDADTVCFSPKSDYTKTLFNG
jgi:peptide/nickel transport system ATP-binding protein